MFSAEKLKVETADGWHCNLLEKFSFTWKDGVVCEFPAEADSDGASTPRPMWNVLPPFGPYWKAAYGHDCLYRGKAVIIINGERTDIKPTKDFCDETFLEMMECSDVDLEARTTIYEGVHLLGWKAFREDREQ